jgi:hypothetical protein
MLMVRQECCPTLRKERVRLIKMSHLPTAFASGRPSQTGTNESARIR